MPWSFRDAIPARHGDPPSYSDQQGEARLEAFIETMEAA
jgi:hypothetical protein